jgi:mono/diheme cytochrome c family protein
MNAKLKILLVILVLIVLAITGCSGSTGQPPAQPASNQSSVSNGEQIYFTGADTQGGRITYTGGPNFGGMMMGSYLTCASCHGPDAHGGRHVMHMEVMDAPAIYYDALTSMMIEESGGTQAAGGYTLGDFRTAVVEGHHPDGDELSSDMPRWQMSDQDLADLFAFLKTISK